MTPDAKRAHWDAVYQRRSSTEVSWYEPYPTRSLELIRASGVSADEPIIDVGGGASFLVDALLAEGFRDVTVLDISEVVLERVRERLGQRSTDVSLRPTDVTAFEAVGRYALWHDRAVFHFLTSPEDRARYIAAMERALTPAGQLIVATFGPEGPERCSGLPVVRYDAASLSELLGPGWVLLRSSLEEHRTPAGVSQSFCYSLFRRR